MSPRAAKPRRQRSLVESLLSITLGLEAITLFFTTLVIFGLNRFDPDWLALVYGGVLIVVYALVAGLQRWSWGVWTGAVLQVALIALGFLEPMMFLVGAGFAVLWIYCFLRARQIDAQKAAWLAAHADDAAPVSNEGDTP